MIWTEMRQWKKVICRKGFGRENEVFEEMEWIQDRDGLSLSSSSGCLGILMIDADWSVASLRNRCHMKILAAGLVNARSTCSHEHHTAGEK
jgi:hypothetical protein